MHIHSHVIALQQSARRAAEEALFQQCPGANQIHCCRYFCWEVQCERGLMELDHFVGLFYGIRLERWETTVVLSGCICMELRSNLHSGGFLFLQIFSVIGRAAREWSQISQSLATATIKTWKQLRNVESQWLSESPPLRELLIQHGPCLCVDAVFFSDRSVLWPNSATRSFVRRLIVSKSPTLLYPLHCCASRELTGAM